MNDERTAGQWQHDPPEVDFRPENPPRQKGRRTLSVQHGDVIGKVKERPGVWFRTLVFSDGGGDVLADPAGRAAAARTAQTLRRQVPGLDTKSRNGVIYMKYEASA